MWLRGKFQSLILNKFDIAKHNPALCPAPFVTLAIRDDSWAQLETSCCCNLQTNIISIDQLKSNIQQGQQSECCNMCYLNDEQGIVSERVKLLTSMPDQNFEKFVQNFEVSEKEIFVKYSNHCMLSCRSCNESSSSMWGQVTGTLNGIFEDFSNNPEKWQFVTDQLRDAHKSTTNPILHLIGGEPLIQDGSFKTLEWLIEQNLAKDFTVRLTTSLAINLTDKLLGLLQHFKSVWMVLSIDSVGENYHYVRWPAKFSKVSTNLEQEIPKLKNTFCVVQPVFSLNNIFYLDQYLTYFEKVLADIPSIVTIQPIHLNDPPYLSLSAIDSRYKPILIKYLESCLTHSIFNNGNDFLKSFLQGEINGIEPNNQFDTFLKFTANFDQRTSTQFEKHNSRLWEILSEQHQQTYNKYRNGFNKSISLIQSLQ